MITKFKIFESQDTFIPMKIENPKIYYKIYVDNSIRKFEVALFKLGLKQSFYRYFNFDVKNFENVIKNNKIVFLIIDLNKNSYQFNLISNEESNLIKNRMYGGEIYITEEELLSSKNI